MIVNEKTVLYLITFIIDVFLLSIIFIKNINYFDKIIY